MPERSVEYGMNVKKLYGCFLQGLWKVCGPDAAKKFDARFRFGRRLNLKHPQSLADKVAFLELHKQSPLAARCTDKYAVRAYVTEKGYGHILVPLAGGPWESVEEIDFSKLPSSFVLKATHGCKMNRIVPDKALLDREMCKKEMHSWLNTTYGRYSLEPHYAKIPHRIYAEAYMGEGLIDYKFHCMNGVPHFVLAVSERKTEERKRTKATLDLFDMQWRALPVLLPDGGETPGSGKVKKPACFEAMKEIAGALSADFDFVRVDLYEQNGRVWFGELTFTPATCVFPYFSEAFLFEMGKNLRI